jgi:hypothetical protein
MALAEVRAAFNAQHRARSFHKLAQDSCGNNNDSFVDVGTHTWDLLQST